MNYKLQDNICNCGIYVFINAAAWAGKKITKKKIKEITKSLKYIKGIGVEPRHLDRVVEKVRGLGFKYTDTYPLPTYDDIKNELKMGNAIIFGLDYERMAHVGLIASSWLIGEVRIQLSKLERKHLSVG
jgi:hypothetical protein